MQWKDEINPAEPLKMCRVAVIVVLAAFIHSAPKYVVGVPYPYPIDGKIVGGDDADIADYQMSMKYQMSLNYKDYGQFCGGALISPNWVLSAAHCVNVKHPADVSVRAGSSLRETDEGVVVQVTQIILSPNFNYTTKHSDISLLQLASNITTAYASPIGMATTSPKSGEIATVTGWGTTSEEDVGLGADILKVVEIPIVSREDCENAYAADNQTITKSMLCTGILGKGGKGVCTGDSGGPMVVGGVVSGIVSWSYKCAEPEFPDVYTDVSEFRDWIKEVTGI